MRTDIPRPTHTPAPLDFTEPHGIRFRLRQRPADEQPASTNERHQSGETRSGGTLRHYLRIQQFQRRWAHIKEDLPPQITRSHIDMISIGGVIGTGLFLGSGAALVHGGPVGSLLGYFIVGTMVYCLCVSIGEMIAFLPNVGGVVGLADLYVDRALGFSLGWAAFYNWSVTLPTEVVAATILTGLWNKGHVSNIVVSAIFLFVATGINCFPSRVYGELEYWLSTFKVLTISSIIIISLIVDLGLTGKDAVGFSKWSKPFAHDYLGVTGNLGRFLGFWSVLLQACFSFFGSEVPGIAAGEVIDASRNVPRALRYVWKRITLFYVGGIFCAGLLVDSSNPLLIQNEGTISSSPFVIAFQNAGVGFFFHAINAAILLSAWSAAASDIYISSRFLFFLARCGHAPQFFGKLLKYPTGPNVTVTGESAPENTDDNDVADLDEEDLHIALQHVSHSAQHGLVEDTAPSDYAEAGRDTENDPLIRIPVITDQDESQDAGEGRSPGDLESGEHTESASFVVPLRAVLASASVGFLSFLGTAGGNASQTFNWLSAVASIASLQSWTGMLYTYIRWHKGTVYHERSARKIMRDYAPTHEEYARAQEMVENITRIKENRHPGQPYLAYYAFGICILILFTNGLSVFFHSGWRIANLSNPNEHSYGNRVSIFLASYVPIPFFILLTLGYKIINQTTAVKVEEMVFYGMHLRREDPETHIPTPWERILQYLRRAEVYLHLPSEHRTLAST